MLLPAEEDCHVVSGWTAANSGDKLADVKAKRLICAVRGHQWRRFRREGEAMRECGRCGYLVRAGADPPKMVSM